MSRLQLLEGVIRGWKRMLIPLQRRNGKEDKRLMGDINADIKMVENWIVEIKAYK